MAQSLSTRDLMFDAAARLFAERGVDNVFDIVFGAMTALSGGG
jgi:hypothetical protein